MHGKRIFAQIGALAVVILVTACSGKKSESSNETRIAKWQDDKTGAVSLTFDDGTINQFRIAVPILDSLGFPGTFFIITGDIPGSKYQPRFIGRPEEQIIRETATIPTHAKNLFERASLANYLPYAGMRDAFTRAGGLYDERGKVQQACAVIDKAFADLRNHKLKPLPKDDPDSGDKITWDEIRQIAARGHEFASHTITHPRLAIMDSANIAYELEKSRDEMLEQLGPAYTFSAECPYGTENDWAMKFALKTYPALRNRMPEPFLEELDRGSRQNPGSSDKEYVQWQRGALTETPMSLMKSWIDTCTARKNIWLVLVFHGVNGIGWEPLTRSELVSYYGYLKSQENKLWIATFGDVTKYIRERMHAQLKMENNSRRLVIHLTHSLGKDYNIPLTLKTYLLPKYRSPKASQGGKDLQVVTGNDEQGYFIQYRMLPNAEPVEITLN